MFKALSDYISHYRPALNFIMPFNNMDEYTGINELKREIPVIISLYSEGQNFDNLGLTVHSLLNQKIKPDRVILWLSDEYELAELPYSVTRYLKNGLEIRFVKNRDAYTPIYYAFKEFRNSIIVQVSDKVIYPSDWLGALYHSYIAYSKEVHVNQAFDIRFKKEQRMELVVNCKYIDEEEAKFSNLPLLAGGVLFPPKSFTSDVLREDIYKNKLDIEPELWLWCMSVVSNRKIRIVKNHKKVFGTTKFFEKLADFLKMSKPSEELSKQASKLSEYYGQNLKNNLNPD